MATRAKSATSTRKKTHWHGQFLKVLAQCGVVKDACKAAKIDRQTAYNHRRDDPAFAEAWEDAIREGYDVLEKEAIRRARKSSDTLLIFLLKAAYPDRFRDNVRIDQTTRVDGPVFVRQPEAPAREPEHTTSETLNRLRRVTTDAGNGDGSRN